MATLNEYQTMIHAYNKAHPYQGNTSQYYDANAIVGGGVNAEQAAAINQPQDAWVEDNWQGWRKSMDPDELAEYDRLAHEKYISDRNKSRTAALAAFGGIAGAGMLGAGMLGSGAMGSGGIGALGGAEGLAAADIAGGLIPAFGTEAGYAAGLGGLAGAGGIGGAELAGIAGNNISAWLPAGTEALGAGTAAVPTWALPGGASAAELAGMGLGGAGSAGGSSWLSQLGSLLGGGGGTGGAGGLGGIGGSGGGSIPGLDGYYTGTGGVDGSLIGSGVTNNTGAASGFSSWVKGLSPETVKNLTSLFGGADSLVKGLFSLYQSNKFSELGKGTPAQQTANSQLDTLLKDPNQIYKMPGWEAGLEAIQRTGAGQGYLGSGNMMLSLNKYGGDFYNDTVGRLNTIATGGQTVQQNYNAGSTDLFGQGANSLGYWMSKYGKSIFDLIGD